jgi:hypothetical protein
MSSFADWKARFKALKMSGLTAPTELAVRVHYRIPILRVHVLMALQAYEAVPMPALPPRQSWSMGRTRLTDEDCAELVDLARKDLAAGTRHGLPSVADLARVADVSENSARKAIADAKRHGLLPC